ncbi:MAG: hypothetical protein HYY84_17690 [Deltaproteobacteria bacterium]|nr:hypothetical protein [Deltaproteobacteria bacterium]
MLRGIFAFAIMGALACGVKAPPLPPLPTNDSADERLSIRARRVNGEWWVRAMFPRFARFTVTRRGVDCPEGRLVLVTDGTTREVELREKAGGRQRFTVVAVTTAGEKFEKSIEFEESTK